MKSIVYFTKKIEPESLIKLYQKLNVNLEPKIAIKVHTGEEGNQNYIKPDFYKDLVNYLDGVVVECNTAYGGERNETSKHLKLLERHGFNIFETDILDSTGDLELEIPNGLVIKKNYVGKNIEKYNSCLVLSHFKGHPMGGYGGALKQLSIGCASSYGKAYIHGAGKTENIWTADHNQFLESMADAAKSVVDLFKDNILYINIMCNMSVDCDCCAVAENPCMHDIGILASTDPVALDQACIDLVYQSNDPGKDHLIERIESRNGIYTIECAYHLGIGNREYEMIHLDEKDLLS